MLPVFMEHDGDFSAHPIDEKTMTPQTPERTQ